MNCSRCSARRAHQIYIVQGELGTYAFDITKARDIVSDGRLAHVIPPDMVRRFLDVNKDWDAQHVEHVNLHDPGIVGQRFGGMALFDGTHRAVRSLREETEFSAYILTPNESNACLIVSDIKSTNVETIAREIKGVLHNNANAGMVEAEISLDDAEDKLKAEAAIRVLLTPEENARVILIITRSNNG